jgi:carboxymethylenebutenolidase
MMIKGRPSLITVKVNIAPQSISAGAARGGKMIAGGRRLSASLRDKDEKKNPLFTAASKNCTWKVEGSKDCKGYLTFRGKDSPMGVIILQEWWGLNQSIQKVAEHVAQQNFRTVIPDLYRGKVAKDAEDAKHLQEALDFQRAVADVQGAVDFLMHYGCKKPSVLGFSMGGNLAFHCLSEVKNLFCGVVFYGAPEVDKFDFSKIKLPMQLHFGNKDSMQGFSDAETANKLENKLKEQNLPALEFHRYENCDHAFMNEDRPEVYNAEQTKVAWNRVWPFWRKHLAS